MGFRVGAKAEIAPDAWAGIDGGGGGGHGGEGGDAGHGGDGVIVVIPSSNTIS